MTRAAWMAGALAMALLAGCDEAPEKPAEPAKPAAPALPERKPGLWNQTVSMGGMSQTFKICLDVATGKKLSMFGQQTSETACARTSMTPRIGGGWDFSSSCDMGSGGQIETKGVATGDLTSKYDVKATSVTTGAAEAQANGTFEMTMSAAWAGACPPDYKPGDMELPGGMRMNISQMSPQAGA